MRGPVRLLATTLIVFLCLTLFLSRYRQQDITRSFLSRFRTSRPSWSYPQDTPGSSSSHSTSTDSGSGKSKGSGAGTGATTNSYNSPSNNNNAKLSDLSLASAPLSEIDKTAIKDADRGFTDKEQALALKKLEQNYGDKLQASTEGRVLNSGATYDSFTGTINKDKESPDYAGHRGTSGSQTSSSGSDKDGSSTKKLSTGGGHGIGGSTSGSSGTGYSYSGNAGSGSIGGSSSSSSGSANSLLNSYSAPGGNLDQPPSVGISGGTSSDWKTGSGSSSSGSASGSSSYSSDKNRDKDRGFTDREQAEAMKKLEMQYDEPDEAKPTWREKVFPSASSTTTTDTTTGVMDATGLASSSSSVLPSNGTASGFVTSVKKGGATATSESEASEESETGYSYSSKSTKSSKESEKSKSEKTKHEDDHDTYEDGMRSSAPSVMEPPSPAKVKSKMSKWGKWSKTFMGEADGGSP